MELTESDVEFENMRAGGPGGQNVDRRATAVRLRLAVENLPLSPEKKDILREHLPPRHLTKDGEILVENGEFRSRQQNKRRALEILNEELEKALERGRQKKRKKARQERVSKRGGGGGEEDLKEKLKKRRRAETTDDLLERAWREAPEEMEDYLKIKGDEAQQDDSEE